MGLSRCPVERHDPQVRFGLIVGSKHDAVTFLDRVEKEPTAIQIYVGSKVKDNEHRTALCGVRRI